MKTTLHPLPSPALLARAFCRLLREEIGADNVSEAARRNAASDDGSCASHDFTDANEVMAAAWKEVTGHDCLSCESDDTSAEREALIDAQCGTINAAWGIAKRAGFTLPTYAEALQAATVVASAAGMSVEDAACSGLIDSETLLALERDEADGQSPATSPLIVGFHENHCRCHPPNPHLVHPLLVPAMSTLVLTHPLCISARLLPAVEIQARTTDPRAFLSWDAAAGVAYLDVPAMDGRPAFEHEITDFRPGRGASGRTVKGCLGALLSFLGACAESRRYASRNGGDPMDGENSDLFPENVGAWAEQMSDELGMLACELEESDNP